MRYMCLIKSSESNGEAPPAVYEAMAEYDRWGRANGVLIESEGLLPSAAPSVVLGHRRVDRGRRLAVRLAGREQAHVSHGIPPR